MVRKRNEKVGGTPGDIRMVRVTMYPHPLRQRKDRPITIITSEKDLRTGTSIEVFIREATKIKDVFFVSEITTVSSTTSLEEATKLINGKIDKQAEFNMAMLYYWDADGLRMVRPGGVLSASQPAPLTAEQIRDVFSKLIKHSNYNRQTIISIAQDGTVVEHKP